MRKLFPVILLERKGEEYIPWEVIEPHENQAFENHKQSLETLANRGGLTYRETYNVLKDRKYDWNNQDKYSETQYEYWVLKILRDFYTRN